MYTSTLFFLLLIAFASAAVNFPKANSTKPAPSNRVTAKSSARSDYHHGYEHHYPHHYGGHLSGYGHHKDLDHYLLPMLLILGVGVLLMPLLSVLMSTVVGNVPVTTLVSGRKRREARPSFLSDETIMHLWEKMGKAIDVFTKDDK